MRKSILMILLILTGCTQLMHGQLQPVKLKKANVYMTTCSGAVEDWSSCKDKASQTCAHGYEVLDRIESIVGARREITFQCNK